MRHPETTVRSIADLLEALGKHVPADAVVWYRGHADTKWTLTPSIARKKNHLLAELSLRKRFQQNAVAVLPNAKLEEWEWLFLMQHHRLPTRLLDWSESPLAALYFAVTEQPKREGAVWALDPVGLNKHANISFEFGREIPAFEIDEILKGYLPTAIAREKTSDLLPIALIGPRNSPRMVAQLGSFTIIHRRALAIDQVGDGKHVWKYTIPAESKPAICKELKLLRLTSLTLFPELDRVADEAKEQLP